MSTPDLRDAARHFFREPPCFSGVPALALTNEGDTVLDLDGRLFDAQEWLTGQPLSGRPVWDRPMPNVVQSLQPRMLASLTAAVARFHRSTTGFKAEGEDEKKPLLVQLTEVARDAEARREALLTEVRVRTEDGDRRVALRWLELLPAAIALAETTLRDRPVCASSVSTVCHGDLWAPHVHFDGTTFVGSTDFGSLHLGSPAVDLAHLILHFNGWSARYAVVDAYCKVSSLVKTKRCCQPLRWWISRGKGIGR